jgi:hypothetical protein
MIILHAKSKPSIRTERISNAPGAMRCMCAFLWLDAGARCSKGRVQAEATS